MISIERRYNESTMKEMDMNSAKKSSTVRKYNPGALINSLSQAKHQTQRPSPQQPTSMRRSKLDMKFDRSMCKLT